jgi:hypothetical protein
MAAAGRFEKKDHVGPKLGGNELGDVRLGDARGVERGHGYVQSVPQKLGRERRPMPKER